MNATEIFERRRTNLAKVIDLLIETQQFKTGKEICEHFGLSASYIAQLLNSKRQIGEKAARELEQQLGLDTLILDQSAEPKVELSPVPAQGVLLQMQVVQQQAFTLISIDSALSFNQDIFHLQAQHYVIQVTESYYFPSLKPGWWLICDKQAELSTAGILCVYLVNGLQLILQLVSKAQDHYEFQSLNETRKIVFQKTDIEKIHPVIAIIPTTSYSHGRNNSAHQKMG
ncbi:S24 family peptidase [Acinetobacter sp.]|uniref:S24 family peptidase n=1 Tax=Acinetobacter sp. TaxID=472 RepID=UPI003BB0EA69